MKNVCQLREFKIWNLKLDPIEFTWLPPRLSLEKSEGMLHEILLALLGYTGDLIIDEREQHKSLGLNLSPDAPVSEDRTFKLAPDLSFIQPSDRFLNLIYRYG